MFLRRSLRSPVRRLPFGLAFVSVSLGLSALVLAPGCSSKPAETSAVNCPSEGDGLTCAGATCASPGAATPGPADSHCGTTIQKTTQAACDWDGGGPDPGATSGAGGSGGAPAGAGGAGAGGDDTGGEYGPTQFGSESDDDDCKYHVTWKSTPICENGGVTVTMTAVNKSDGTPLTGAAPYAEVYLDTTHTSPNGPCACKTSSTTEGPPGTYTIGPVFFDAPGKWTMRFHFFGTCNDFSDSSPHGHAAYYVTVP